MPARSILRLDWPELEGALPDRGFPRGVIELAARPRFSPRARHSGGSEPESMRGGVTCIAIAALSAVHAADPAAWCAWITPALVGGRQTPSLYAPALVRANVDLDRLLVVRPPPRALARTVVKAAASGAFGLVIVDVPRHQDLGVGASRRQAPRAQPSFGGRDGQASVDDGGAIVVRRLALAAEESGTTSVLLTSALTPRPVPWPVALRLEVERRPEALSVHVTKDRRGRVSCQHVVRLPS